jgi:hypothetical protein
MNGPLKRIQRIFLKNCKNKPKFAYINFAQKVLESPQAKVDTSVTG